MLSPVERVMALKRVSLFAQVPDDTLAALGSALDEVELGAGSTLFEKGDPGDAMYVVVAGQLRAHDGGKTLNSFAPGDVFGEMAALDGEARSASITAGEDSLLLRLERENLYDLMDSYSSVARGIIQVLLQRLRARMADLSYSPGEATK
jgi:CRP-like cAMP-binding protein